MAGLPQTISLEVATPLGLVLRARVTGVTAPSVDGEFGVLPGHLPLLAALRPGVLKYRIDGRDHVAAVGAGFVEAGSERMLLLCDVFALPSEIDVAAVQEELEQATRELASFGERHEGARYEELQRRVDWCHARLLAKAQSEALL
jgi:F-type H+-transporting ATPase subunit epsilon